MKSINPPSKTIQICAAICAALAFATHSYAASVVYAAEQYNGFADAAGALLPVGNQVRIGVFTLDDTAIRAAADTAAYAVLEANFSEIGRAHIGDSYGIPGYFATPAPGAVVPVSNTFANAQLYLWVFKTSNNLDPNGTYSNVVETGVYWLDKALEPRWRFPAQTDIPNSTNIDIGDLTNRTDNLRTGARVAAGSFEKFADGGLGSAKQFSTQAPIPEPRTFALLGVAALGFFARRRRT